MESRYLIWSIFNYILVSNSTCIPFGTPNFFIISDAIWKILELQRLIGRMDSIHVFRNTIFFINHTHKLDVLIIFHENHYKLQRQYPTKQGNPETNSSFFSQSSEFHYWEFRIFMKDYCFDWSQFKRWLNRNNCIRKPELKILFYKVS